MMKSLARLVMPIAAALAASVLILSPAFSPAAAEEQAGRVPLERLEIVTATGAHAFDVEVARSEKERAQGLMFRRSLPQDHGMLFLFESERPIAMWMKNTYISLDMVFVSRNGRVRSIARGAVPLSEAIIPSGGPVYAVIELAAGAADAIGLSVGDRVRYPGFER
ncbi:MAG TPA: DUF192 domain-containing protein [Methylocystis sp.]|nr:DUF192 domain-containing protein [Methylocystis sp.]